MVTGTPAPASTPKKRSCQPATLMGPSSKPPLVPQEVVTPTSCRAKSASTVKVPPCQGTGPVVRPVLVSPRTTFAHWGSNGLSSVSLPTICSPMCRRCMVGANAS